LGWNRPQAVEPAPETSALAGKAYGSAPLSAVENLFNKSPIPEQKAPSGISLEGAFLQVIPDYGLASP
jgi:hypothetical protein